MNRHNGNVIPAAKPVCRRTTERGKTLNPEYSIDRDQPTSRASPLGINALLFRVYWSVNLPLDARGRFTNLVKHSKHLVFMDDKTT